MATRRPRFLEFFAGGGMARIGLASSFDCVFANDLDAAKCVAYRANFGAEHLVQADVADLRAADVPDAELAWASFPCQDLSLAGARAGLSAARSGAFWAFWRLMETLRAERRDPATIVLENVPGLLSSRRGEDFAALVETLAASGRKVGALLLDAADHVPQSRLRLFVIAHRGPVPAGVAEPVAPLLGADPALVAAGERLSPGARDAWLWWKAPRPRSNRPPLSALIERNVGEAHWRSDAKRDRLISQLSSLHRKRLKAAERAGGFQVGAVYRRMRNGQQAAEARYDGLAGCLRTLKGGSSRQLLLITEDGHTRLRPLLPVEGGRLMGLPGSYILPHGATAAFNLLGDGVCAPVAANLADCVLAPLHGAAAFESSPLTG